MDAIIISIFVIVLYTNLFMRQIYLSYLVVSSFLTSFFLTSCKDNDYPIPDVPVNVSINLDLPSYIPLNAPGGYVYVNGGSRGLIIYRNFDEFVAMDRHSTFNSDDPCAVVEVNPDNAFELIDTCSGSVFSIMNGVVLVAAQYGLKRYNSYWDGAYTVTVSN